MNYKKIPVLMIACLFGAAVSAQQLTDSSLTNRQVADSVYTKIDKNGKVAEFPGGVDGWRKYLEHNLHYPKKAQKKSVQGAVRIAMLVTNDGTVKEVKAMNDPGGGLAEEAERVIREGPKWIPAEVDGKKVNYRFAQTITFQLL